MEAIRRLSHRIDDAVARSKVGRFFRLEGSGHAQEIRHTRFLTEVRAGITTFFTMAYIIAVNANILSDSGGTCVCNDASDPTCVSDNDYKVCLIELNRDLITATAAMAALSSFFFGLVTNLPVALASGMGLNAYLTYQVVGFHGTGRISYGLALTAVFVEGFIFLFLSLVGMRQWLVRILPNSLKVASGCGIGFFLAEIGLSYSAGIGAISGSSATPLDIAGCAPEYRNQFGECTSHKMQNPTMWIGIFCGGVLTAFLMSYKIKSAMIIGIAFVSIISWPRDTPFTFFPHNAFGDAQFEFFKKVVTFHPIKRTLNALDWNVSAAPSQFLLALVTFLYVDIIDCTATLFSMARFSGIVDPKTGDFPRSTLAYCTDALSISIGALFGTSPVTAFIESGAGIAEGGKTGLTAMTTGVCFFFSIFFAPIFASIPPWATGCTLVIVGCMMMRQVVAINWSYIGDAVPAFVTVVFIPLSYSAAYGLIAGMVTYVALNGPIYLIKVLSGGRILPVDEDAREYWTYKPGGKAPWFVSAARMLRGRMGSGVEKRVSLPSSDSDEAFHKDVGGHGVQLAQYKCDAERADAPPSRGLERNGNGGSKGSNKEWAATVKEVQVPEIVVDRYDLRQFRVPPEQRAQRQ